MVTWFRRFRLTAALRPSTTPFESLLSMLYARGSEPVGISSVTSRDSIACENQLWSIALWLLTAHEKRHGRNRIQLHTDLGGDFPSSPLVPRLSNNQPAEPSGARDPPPLLPM